MRGLGGGRRRGRIRGRGRGGGRGRFQGIEQKGGEALEVEGPEGEGDEEPVVDVPDEVGFGSGGDASLQGEEALEQWSAVCVSAEGEGREMSEIALEGSVHCGRKAEIAKAENRNGAVSPFCWGDFLLSVSVRE